MYLMRESIGWIVTVMQACIARRGSILLAIAAVALVMSVLPGVTLPFDTAWIALCICGVPILQSACVGLVTRFDIRANVLVSLALLGAVYIGEIFAAAEVAFIMQLGELLEDYTVDKARAGIEKLMQLAPQTARRVATDGETVIAAEQVCLGDVLRVLPGEAIPVDGVIIRGQSSVNQAVLTGESLPLDKSTGDTVYSGTVNQYGVFDMRATKVGADSSLQRMIQLVQATDTDSSAIVRLADRWATWIVVAALLCAGVTWYVTGEMIRAVTVLVVFCPCSLVLATPTAIVAAIGNATKHGFLVREGDALERLAAVRIMAFDKTGTLTHGTLEVVAVVGDGAVSALLSDPAGDSALDAEYLLYRFTAAAESFSEHPVGKAIVQGYGRRYGEALPKCTDFSLHLGRGVSAVVEGRHVLAGSDAFMREHGLDIPATLVSEGEVYLQQGASIIYVSFDGVVAGCIAIADTVRAAARGAVRALTDMGVRTVLLTGDHAATARYIAAEVGITDVHAQCLPEDKLHIIDAYQADTQAVCMLGDGINDAPALKKAVVGIAMGRIGSDIAVDAADITLVDDNIAELPHLFALSRRMLVTIKRNLTFSLLLNFVSIAFAATGLLGPVLGALVHNAGAVIVVLNSVFLLHFKYAYLDGRA